MPTPSVANQYKVVDVPGGGKNNLPKQIRLDIWDTCGQESLRTMTQTHYHGSHAVLIVYGVDSPESFKSVDSFVYMIDQHCGKNALKFLVGNKCDLEDLRLVSFEDAHELGAQCNLKSFETSATDARRDTIKELFQEVTIELARQVLPNENIKL